MPDTLEQLETELGPDLRALAPEADLAFLARVTAPRAAHRRPRLPVWLPVLALAVLAAALVVPAGLLTTGRDGAGGGGDAVPSQAAPEAAGDAGSDAAGGALAPQPARPVPVPPAGRETLRRGDRAVERSAELELATPPGELQQTAGAVIATTQRLGGYVADSQVSAERDGGSAAFTLRVPAAQLDVLLARLGELADVQAQREASRDVTGTVVSAEDLVDDARDERRALLRALGRATTDARVDALRRRLRDNRSTIARREAALRRAQRRTEVATVFVALVGREDGGAWTPGDAAGDARRVLEVLAGGLLVAGAALAPFLLLGALSAALARAARRRRREAALRG